MKDKRGFYMIIDKEFEDWNSLHYFDGKTFVENLNFLSKQNWVKYKPWCETPSEFRINADECRIEYLGGVI